MTIRGAQETNLRFEKFPEKLRAQFIRRLAEFKGPLIDAIRTAEPERSGKLRAATGGGIYQHPNRVALVVGVRVDMSQGKSKRGSLDAGKISALEYGSHAAIKVSAHREMRAVFFGRLEDPTEVTVKMHNRLTNIQAYHFLHGPFDAMRERALAALQEAAVEAAEVA